MNNVNGFRFISLREVRLWERWDGGEEPLETCTLLTTELLAPYHDRMPVILRREDHEAWLDAGMSKSELLTPLIGPYPHEEMAACAVSALVNSPSNDTPRCVEPVFSNQITRRGCFCAKSQR